MAEPPIPPHPKNAPGPFYVENGYCMACEAPYYEAPDLLAYDDEELGYHCYFKRQPETSEEIDRAVMACVVSCVSAVRYAGNDPEVLKRFSELHRAESCDVAIGCELSDVVDKTATNDPELTTPMPFVDRGHPLWDRDLDS